VIFRKEGPATRGEDGGPIKRKWKGKSWANPRTAGKLLRGSGFKEKEIQIEVMEKGKAENTQGGKDGPASWTG